MRYYFPHALYGAVFSVCCFLTLPFLIPTNLIEQTSETADTIIVLGGGVTHDCQIGATLKARMDKAISLYHQKVAQKIILTGGPQHKDGICLEAHVMEQYALAKKVPAKAIFKERNAVNTYQNAYYSIGLMKQKGMKKAIVVTSEFHIRRANCIFQQYGLTYKMAAAKNVLKGKLGYQQLLKEHVLLCFHAVFGVPTNFGLNLKEKTLAAVLKSMALNEKK